NWPPHKPNWYPPHVLPLPGDPLNKCVCTAETDYTRWPHGLILYRVLAKKKKKEEEKRQGQGIALDHDIRAVPPDCQKTLDRVLGKGAPAAEHFIIVPAEYYYKIKSDRDADTMEPKLPPFLDPHNPAVQFRHLGLGLIEAGFHQVRPILPWLLV